VKAFKYFGTSSNHGRLLAEVLLQWGGGGGGGRGAAGARGFLLGWLFILLNDNIFDTKFPYVFASSLPFALFSFRLGVPFWLSI